MFPLSVLSHYTKQQRHTLMLRRFAEHGTSLAFIRFLPILFCHFQSRLKPGRMLLVDTEEKKIIQDVELKLKIAQSRPHSQWLKEQVRKSKMSLIFIRLKNAVEISN